MTARAPLLRRWSEVWPSPDTLQRFRIRYLAGQAARRLAGRQDQDAAFAIGMAAHPIVEAAAVARLRHDREPAAFYAQMLGPRLKYSCSHFDGSDCLVTAEDAALALSCRYAGIEDGQSILDFGCGWGALTFWLAETYPAATITAVATSPLQRDYVTREAARRGFGHIRVLEATPQALVQDLADQAAFDRILAIEIFEQFSNWRPVLAAMRRWLRPEGLLLAQIATHRSASYRLDPEERGAWLGRYLMTGAVMPSQTLIRQFPDLMTVEESWHWNGLHYQATAEAWLRRIDANRAQSMGILAGLHGREAAAWMRRWRLLHLTTAGLFGHAEGRVWGVSHYRMSARRTG